MATNIKIKMDDTGRVLLKRYLNKDGKAQEFFTKEVAKTSDNYIPFDRGRLKNIMIEIQTDKIIYSAPYAKKQYYTNKGNGRSGTSQGGLRGKFWDRRMWNDRSNEIVKSVAQFVGGRSK